jgi:hypothetical protein
MKTCQIPFEYTSNPVEWLKLIRSGRRDLFYITDSISDRYTTSSTGKQIHDREFMIMSFHDSIQLWQFGGKPEWFAEVKLSGAITQLERQRFPKFDAAYEWAIGFICQPYCMRPNPQDSPQTWELSRYTDLFYGLCC